MTSGASGFNRLPSGRTLALTASVLLHVLGLLAVQRTVSNYMAPEPPQPLVLVMELPERDATVQKPVPVAPTAPSPVPKAVVKVPALPPAKAQTTATPTPLPAAAAAVQAVPTPGPSPAPAAPSTPVPPSGSGVLTAATGTASASTTAAGSATGSGTVSSGAGRVELPSSDAQYLNNPKPEYPALSRRRGEQGRAIVNVLISVDGTAEKAEIKVSSGFERLDQAALATVKSWRYVPGNRGGVPEAMWFSVPIQFVID
jgi:protein TonB